MKHIDIRFVGYHRVTSMAHKILDHFKIAEEGCEMHGSKAVLTFALAINPIG
jgi:hypothetical protein